MIERKLTGSELFSLKANSPRKVAELFLHNEKLIYDSIIQLLEDNAYEGVNIVDLMLYLVQFKLSEPERLIFIKGWQNIANRTQLSLQIKKKYENKIFSDSINTINTELEFISNETVEKIKDYKHHASEYYKSIKSKSKPVLIRFQTNLNRIQVEKLHNALVLNNFIGGVTTYDLQIDHNRTFKKFMQLFFKSSFLTELEPTKIKWLLVGKNKMPNKTALCQLFLQMADYPQNNKTHLINFIHGKDLFFILEKNFCDISGSHLTKFTHSNLQKSRFKPEYISIYQKIFQNIL